MLITYFDEVKYQKGRQPYEWLAGLMIRTDALQTVEDRVARLAKESYGSSQLGPETEFHASHIVNNQGPNKKLTVPARIAVMSQLLQILDDKEHIKRVWVRIDVARMYSNQNLAELAFMFFVERVNRYAKKNSTTSLLVGDYESEPVTASATSALAWYRSNGTPYLYGRGIKAIVDTAHYVRSHNSRMIQLADFYAWCLQAHFGTRKQEPARQGILDEFAKRNLHWPDTYKAWPSDR